MSRNKAPKTIRTSLAFMKEGYHWNLHIKAARAECICPVFRRNWKLHESGKGC
jgi:hypothetical protein